MNPVIALVGRPNVGKSTLFNRLTKTRDALVADFPGLTRDRKYGTGKVGGKPYTVIDTGGISGDEEGIDLMMAGQSLAALDEADIVLFMVDARAGLNMADEIGGLDDAVNELASTLDLSDFDVVHYPAPPGFEDVLQGMLGGMASAPGVSLPGSAGQVSLMSAPWATRASATSIIAVRSPPPCRCCEQARCRMGRRGPMGRVAEPGSRARTACTWSIS